LAAERGVCVPWLDFDGRWLVVSRARWKHVAEGPEECPGEPLRALAIDTSAERLELVELAEVTGVVTIDD
jgi:hypothetical protein